MDFNRLILSLNLDNDAFQNGNIREAIATVLHTVARNISMGHDLDHQSILDENGNKIGSCNTYPEEPQSRNDIMSRANHALPNVEQGTHRNGEIVMLTGFRCSPDGSLEPMDDCDE